MRDIGLRTFRCLPYTHLPLPRPATLPCSAFPPRCGSKVVRAPGFEPRPLGDGAAAGPRWFPIRRAGSGPRVSTLLRPASRRVLPVLLPPVDSQVEQPIAVIHVFDAPCRGPVSLEDFAGLS